MTKFNELPAEVREDVKRALRAYDRAYVIYEYGAYHTSVAIGLKAHYAEDHRVVGEYRADEVFTEDERIINYIESFHEYPIQYKGKRDYKILHEIEGNWEVKFKFDDEKNLVMAGVEA